MSDRIAVFDCGRIQQIGTPAELYERPATRFVAGFVGETNFAPAEVLGREGTVLRVSVAGTPMPASGRIAAAPGAAGVLAIRPERLRLSAGGDGVPAEVVDLIYVGNARRFVLRLPDGQEWSAMMQAEAAEAVTSRPGDAVRLSWSAAHAAVFPV